MEHTIFVYDVDLCDTVRIVMPYAPVNRNDVWLHVLRDRLADSSIQREEVPQVLADLGDDVLDYNIVAVLPGNVVSVELPDED